MVLLKKFESENPRNARTSVAPIKNGHRPRTFSKEFSFPPLLRREREKKCAQSEKRMQPFFSGVQREWQIVSDCSLESMKMVSLKLLTDGRRFADCMPVRSPMWPTWRASKNPLRCLCFTTTISKSFSESLQRHLRSVVWGVILGKSFWSGQVFFSLQDDFFVSCSHDFFQRLLWRLVHCIV